ncbi:FAD-dependent monooxygenase [Puia sp.]|jgi:2-polyprenyl-6-methoxyphenol hydroxylase-like FAD-dependent oxidoreductase|uniref:FAD-dependent monooxygenase n=1 Tax=Puia sp. TaxID=2045100 RepID=UPI002F417CD2
MKTKKILISGASIAGPALAFWLNRYGFETTIIERAPVLRPGGYAVDFRGAAMEVLKRMELLESIRRFETRAGTITMVDAFNNKLASMPDGFTSGELEILRGDLARVLFEVTQYDTEYIFNDSITKMREDEEGVEVEFFRGAPQRFDLVIGADGLHSNVRRIAFGEESQFVRDLGLYVAVFTIPNFMNLGMNGLYYGEVGRRVGIFGAKKGTAAMASFFFASDPLTYDRRDTMAQKEILRKRFKDMGWQVPRLLHLMDSAPDLYFDSVSQVMMDRWSKGRVALTGDAAHCASPASGMGTSLAVIGAYVLAGEFKRANGDHVAAFDRYEAAMRGIVHRSQKMANGASWFVPNSRFKLWMSHQVWKVLPYTPWKNMMIEMPAKVANSIELCGY